MRHLRQCRSEDIFTQFVDQDVKCLPSVRANEHNYEDQFLCGNDPFLADDSSDYDDESDFSFEPVSVDPVFEVESRGDPRYAQVYVNEIEQVLQMEEPEHVIPLGRIERTQGTKIKELRMMLGNWLVNLSFVYPSTTETLYQCVALLDRYLSKSEVNFNNLQLIGCCCMWICAKIEFHTSASLDPLIRCCHDKFTKNDFIKAETQILTAVDYNIHAVTSISFLRRFITILNASDELALLASYICECSILTVESSYFRPSLIAFCSIAAACIAFNCSDSIYVLKEITSNFTWKEVSKCLTILLRTARMIINHDMNGVFRKYSHKKINEEECAGANIIRNTELGPDLVQSLEQYFF